jgi:FKBP-type peptidyl-prolyl cis-trans isomerase (trigger factor)
MGKQRATSQKRQREAAKEAKATAKRERRQARGEAESNDVDGPLEVPPAAVLELLAEAHRQFRNDDITFEEYDVTKADLLRQLRVD